MYTEKNRLFYDFLLLDKIKLKYFINDTLGDKLAFFIKFKNEILRPYDIWMTKKG